jgi:C4-dicarboxylate-specific signal transduction histidine kinase
VPLVDQRASSPEAKPADVFDMEWLADVGELAGPLAHEFNNYLNCVLLHLAVIELEVAPELQLELLAIRRLGGDVAELVRQFQEHRRATPFVTQGTDVNTAILRTLARLAGQDLRTTPAPTRILTADGEVRLVVQLADHLPLVQASCWTLERLVRFLTSNAMLMGKSGQRCVTIRTEPTDSGVQLDVADTGPSVPPSDLSRLFEPSTCCRPGSRVLELAACKSLVRRLGGKIQAVNVSDGLAVRVRLNGELSRSAE